MLLLVVVCLMMCVPTTGIASDTSGNVAMINLWNMVRDKKTVIPAKRFMDNNNNNSRLSFFPSRTFGQ